MGGHGGDASELFSLCIPFSTQCPRHGAQERPEVPRARIKFRDLDQAGNSTSQSACGLQGTIPRPAALTDLPLDFVRNASSGDLLRPPETAALGLGSRNCSLKP